MEGSEHEESRHEEIARWAVAVHSKNHKAHTHGEVVMVDPPAADVAAIGAEDILSQRKCRTVTVQMVFCCKSESRNNN